MSFIDYLDQIEDHRTDINKEYNLGDIIFLTMADVLAGAHTYDLNDLTR